jgi:hypothetical protein
MIHSADTFVSKGPLSADQHRQLALATTRARKIRTAAGVAALNGWATGVIAALSVPFALFSITGFLVAAALVIVTYNEFMGRRRLLRFDPAAAIQLGWNQFGLLAMITVYCLWMIFRGLTGPNPLAAEMAAHPEYADALGSLSGFGALYKQLLVIVYGAVIVLSAVFQGFNAIYYFTRRRHIEAYIRETPAWVVEVQRSMTAA